MEDVHLGLAWQVPRPLAKTHPEYVAPSWSWAALDFSDCNFNYAWVYNMAIVGVSGDGRFTPLADIEPVPLPPVEISSVPTNRWKLKVRGQLLQICSSQVPVAFLDRRESSTMDYDYRFDRMKELDKGFATSRGLAHLQNCECRAPRGPGHQELFYLQIGRAEAPRHSLKPKSMQDLPVIVALILKKEGTKLDSDYSRVGRAYIPIDATQEQPLPWPTETVILV
jgi:hypothetical protein